MCKIAKALNLPSAMVLRKGVFNLFILRKLRSAMQAISFPQSPFPLTSGRKRELWEQPFWNNRILPIRFHCAVCIYGVGLKWLLQGSRFPTAGQGERRLWERDCSASWHRIHQLCYHSNINSGIELRVGMIKSLNQSLWLHITIHSTPILPPSFDLDLNSPLEMSMSPPK